jgi:septation ring formation regulator EzrA
MRTRSLLPIFAILLSLSGCSSVYYAAWQKLGYEKRDILVSRVESARDSQQAAKEQIKTTYQRFQELTHYNGGDLEAEYNKINDAYESAQSRAQTVSKRIDSVDKVANDMFDEWQKELSEYQNQDLRRSSEQKLNDSKQKYRELLAAMRRSEQKMQPVLTAFHDQVLFLKHNLNAQAISSLSTTTAQIQADIQSLIKDMDASISEANAFIDNLKKS